MVVRVEKGLWLWPDAFSAEGSFHDEELSAVEIQLIGGLLGSRPTMVKAAIRILCVWR